MWDWFIRLHSARGSTGFGMNPISYSEMTAFFALRGERPSQWELETIRVLDRAAMQQIHENSKASAPPTRR